MDPKPRRRDPPEPAPGPPPSPSRFKARSSAPPTGPAHTSTPPGPAPFPGCVAAPTGPFKLKLRGKHPPPSLEPVPTPRPASTPWGHSAAEEDLTPPKTDSTPRAPRRPGAPSNNASSLLTRGSADARPRLGSPFCSGLRPDASVLPPFPPLALLTAFSHPLPEPHLALRGETHWVSPPNRPLRSEAESWIRRWRPANFVLFCLVRFTCRSKNIEIYDARQIPQSERRHVRCELK